MCPYCRRQKRIANGEARLREKWPAYADAILSELPLSAREELLARVSYTTRPGAEIKLPLPSAVFRGLDPAFDARLIREGHQLNVDLCRGMAAVPHDEQLEFYERFLADPAEAQRWASLPRWKRPLMAGTPLDRQIWDIFLLERIGLEFKITENKPSTKLYEGQRLRTIWSLVDAIQRWSLKENVNGISRLTKVLTEYGYALETGQDLGDVTRPPYYDARLAKPGEGPSK